jgi:acyl carrier protein
MSEESLWNALREVIVDKLGVPPNAVQESTSFTDDLGADSLDMVALMMELEERFGITIMEQEVSEFVTLGDAARFIQDRMLPAEPCTAS